MGKKTFSQFIAHHTIRIIKSLHQKSTFWSSNQNLLRLTLDGAFQSNCRLVFPGTKAEGFSGVSNVLTVTRWLSVHHISSEWQARTFSLKKKKGRGSLVFSEHVLEYGNLEVPGTLNTFNTYSCPPDSFVTRRASLARGNSPCLRGVSGIGARCDITS